MTVIPTAALMDRITIAPHEGVSGTGEPVYGPARKVRARLVGKRRAVRTSDGVDVIADATADIRPGLTVPPESRVTTSDGRRWEVLAVADARILAHTHHVSLILEGPKP